MAWDLKQIAQWVNGQIISEKQTQFSQVGTDTRKDLSQQIFIALKGDNYDAHNYLDQAVQKGAGLLMVHELKPEFQNLIGQVSIIQVTDTLKALQEFSHNYRQTLNTKIIGITGSNGKTTTKEFTAAILSQFKKTHFNQGSFNNHWGVPLTLLQIPSDAEFAVIEMGMNHAGEITQLVQIADPDIVVCTMVGRAHIEFFGTIEKIAEAKREIYLESREDTIRVFNQDQELTFDMMYPVAKKYPASRMLSFSQINDKADVFMRIEEINAEGMLVAGLIAGVPGRSTIPLFGQHNLINILAAANVAYAAGMSPDLIWKSLPLCKSTWGRNQFIKSQNGQQILFDGYNANPDSMRALIDNVYEMKVSGRKIGVFGQMKELGELSAQMHFELGQLVTTANYDFIYFIGENYSDFEKGMLSQNFKNYMVATDLNERLGQHFIQSIKPGDLITVKGSRGAKTERFVELCDPLDWQVKP